MTATTTTSLGRRRSYRLATSISIALFLASGLLGLAGSPASARWRRNLCWNLIGAVSSRVRILGQAARSIGVSASFWVSVCHPSTLRMVI